MPNSLDQFTRATADWRSTIRQNNQRTYIVIFLFILMYCCIGLLVDVYFYESAYPDAPLFMIFQSIITFKFIPVVTLIMIAIAIVSLLITFALYDKLMLLGTTYYEITPESARNPKETQLYNVVEEMKIAAGLRYMPRVFLIEADYMNAFASGYSEKSAMVAITNGLFAKLDREELQAVMAHELSHIRHLDIKITLIATILANLMIMMLDQFYYISRYSKGSKNKGKNSLLLVIFLLRLLLPIINILLLLYLSRKRELMADAGAVQLMRANEPLARALLKIDQDHVTHQADYKIAYESTKHENIRREAYIYDPAEVGIKPLMSIGDVFSTHPSLSERLNALGFKRKSKE